MKFAETFPVIDEEKRKIKCTGFTLFAQLAQKQWRTDLKGKKVKISGIHCPTHVATHVDKGNP